MYAADLQRLIAETRGVPVWDARQGPVDWQAQVGDLCVGLLEWAPSLPPNACWVAHRAPGLWIAVPRRPTPWLNVPPPLPPLTSARAIAAAAGACPLFAARLMEATRLADAPVHATAPGVPAYAISDQASIAWPGDVIGGAQLESTRERPNQATKTSCQEPYSQELFG